MTPVGIGRSRVAELETAHLLRVEDGNHGEYRPRPNEFVADGVAFIRAADMLDGRVMFATAERINETARLRIRKGIGQAFDVLLSHKGTVGKVAYAPFNSPPFVCSPQTTFWRSLDHKVINPRFLFYYLRSSDFQNQLSALKGETDMADYVSLSTQRQLTLEIPPPDVQQSIANLLGAMDDKIDANRRQTEVLVDATMTAYRTIAARAHSSDLVEQVAAIRGGSTPSTESAKLWSPGVHSWATPRDMATLRSPVLWRTERKISNEGLESISSRLLPKGTVLLSSRAPIGYLAIAAMPLAINQGFIALVPNGRLSSEYMCCWVRASMRAIEALGNGTTFMEVSKRSFRVLRVPIPPSSLLSQFEAFARPAFQLMLNLERQVDHLALLRDLLLPKLISGELRARKTEQAVETLT